MKMALIRGVDVLVTIKQGTEDVIIGGQKDATLSISADTLETTTKDTGDWRTYLSGLKQWSLTCDGLYIESDAAQTALWNAFQSAEEVTVTLSKPTSSSFTASGQAVITSIEYGAAMEDALTFNVEFQGTGALTVS